MKYYTLFIAAVCVIVFILQLVIPGFTDTFVLQSDRVLLAPWTLVTSIFLHASLEHLLFNLFALVLFGLILESLIGSKRLLLVYFVSGIVASIAAAIFYPSSLGASGAIFGIIGTLAVIRPLMGVWAFGVPLPMFIAAILWVIGDLLGFAGATDNIGHAAHLAGIFVGILLGTIFILSKSVKGECGLFSKKDRIKIPEDAMREWENRFMRR
jgi:hypothetical protein